MPLQSQRHGNHAPLSVRCLLGRSTGRFKYSPWWRRREPTSSTQYHILVLAHYRLEAGMWITLPFVQVWCLQFALIMLDVPFPLLALLTLWRFPWLIVRLVKETENAGERYSIMHWLFWLWLLRHILVLKYLLNTTKDIPCAIFFVILTLCWCVVSIVALCKEYKRGDDEHKALMLVFVEFLLDLPFFFLALLVSHCPTWWRVLI